MAITMAITIFAPCTFLSLLRRFCRMATSTRLSPASGDAPEDLRDAWSAPLPREVFEVQSLGPERDAAALGVSIALCYLVQEGYRPVSRTLRNASARRILTSRPYQLRRAGVQSSSTSGCRLSAGSGPRCHTSRSPSCITTY